MDDRLQTKQEEFNFLAKEYQAHPELFLQSAFVEDAEMLGEFGIYIPGKELCAPGLLKLWPEDFIVEEQTQKGGSSVSGTRTPASEEGGTVYATLVKCGLSTIEAVEDIAQKLGIRIEDIAYAGIKDKDAITAQLISLRRTSVAKVEAIKTPHFFLKDIYNGQGAVEKGGLTGNRFTIVVRTEPSFFVGEQASLFVKKLTQLKGEGFYNFFYLQRFGTPRLHNFAWARQILRGEYEAAVRDIIAFEGSRELPYFKQMRKKMDASFGRWDEIQKMIEPLPLMFRHEQRLVNHLAAHPGDYAGALKMIPEQITLWMYALSSLLFNQYISNCLMRGDEPPAQLPFFLSHERAAYEPYRDMLEALGMYPPPFNNLKPFPQVQVRTRYAETKDTADIRNAEVIDEGVVLEFELGKGQYATTFLSHLFNLAGGKLPDTFSKNRVDSKAVLGEEPLAPVLQNFTEVIHPKGENMFEQLGSEV
jgi:tRNA(Glu) U13 pseudouridine synthase TruD